jgi:hypothetical protein
MLSGGSIKKNEVGGTCGSHGRGEESVCMVLVGKPKGLGIPRRKWEDGIRVAFWEIGGGGVVEWIGSG